MLLNQRLLAEFFFLKVGEAHRLEGKKKEREQYFPSTDPTGYSNKGFIMMAFFEFLDNIAHFISAKRARYYIRREKL